MLSLLLAARHEDGSPMSDVELRDELMTLLTAGHETTATGLSWAFERLMRTPRVMEQLIDSLDDDEYLDAVVKETLRIRPVIMDVARKLTRPTEVAGYTLPAGTLVLPAIAAVHARPDLYPEPEEFRPERFIDGQPESYAWIPFGGGVRRCIGASFAQVEMRVVLREVLRRVRLRAPSARPERPRVQHVTVVPARGARAVVTERRERAGTRRSWPPRPPSSYCAGHLGARLDRRRRLTRRRRDARLRLAAALLRAPDLVELALHVPDAHRRDQEQQDEDHRAAGGPGHAHRLLGALDPPARGPLGHDRRDDDERAERDRQNRVAGASPEVHPARLAEVAASPG